MDMGDFVIIINAEKVALTGQKLQKKMAYRHSGYPGGLSAMTYEELLEKNPTRAVEKAVRGMLPKNPSVAPSSPSSRSTRAPSTRTLRSSPSRTPSTRSPSKRRPTRL